MKHENLRPVNVLFVPSVIQNPYQDLLTAALNEVQVKVTYATAMPSWRWLLTHREQIQIIHIHWIHTLYTYGWQTPLRFIDMVVKLLLARMLGYKLVWTVHNLLPHRTQRYIILLDIIGRYVVANLADHIIGHCHHAVESVQKRFSFHRRQSIIPLGIYKNIYSSTIQRAEARRKLNLAQDTFVYLFFGLVRSYKGADLLIQAFRKLELPNTCLVICGRCIPDSYEETIRAMADDDPHIRLYLEYIPDEQVQDFFRATDVVVCPFRETLTSSSVMLGLSFGKPVIAPSLGCLPELVTPNLGLLYNFDQTDALEHALMQIQQKDLVSMSQAAEQFTNDPSVQWLTIAKQTREVYLHVLSNTEDLFTENGLRNTNDSRPFPGR